MPKRKQPATTVSPVTDPKGVGQVDQSMIDARLLFADMAAIKAALGISNDQSAGSKIDHLIAEYSDAEALEHKEGGWKTIACRLRHLVRLIGALVASNITFEVADQYLDDRVEEGVTRTTAGQELVTLSAVLTWAVRRRKLSFNPLTGYQFKLKHGTRDRLYTDDEVDALLSACLRTESVEMHSIISIMRWTGVRPKEIYTSRRSSLDFKTGLLTVTEEVAKTSVERVAAILPDALASIRLLPDSMWLIPSYKDPSKHIPKETLTGQWHRVVDVSCINWENGKRPILYSMRHTLATKLALEYGYGVFELMAAMGWTDPGMAKKYVKPGAKHALDMAARIQAKPVGPVGKPLPLDHVAPNVGNENATISQQPTQKKLR